MTARGWLHGRGHIVVGSVLIVVAVVMTATHLAEHADLIQVMSPNLQDLLIGFPMAGTLGLAGFVALIWR